MTRVAPLLFALAAAFAVGAFAGTRGWRAWERSALPPRRVRPPAVEAALAAWEEHSAAPPALPATDLDPESAADVAFLVAAASGDDGALLAMARLHDGRDASARALWTLVLRSPDEPTREARRRAFAVRWPDAWVLDAGSRRSP